MVDHLQLLRQHCPINRAQGRARQLHIARLTLVCPGLVHDTVAALAATDKLAHLDEGLGTAV